MIKKILVGIITTSNDYDSILNINLKLYNEIYNQYGELYIINLNNLILFKKKKTAGKIKIFEKKIKIFKKKIKIFEPNNVNDFISFCDQKKLIAFNNLGKNFSDFKIYYFLNKINMVQILLMNIGHLSDATHNDAINISSNNLRSLISSIIFKYNRKITRFIFRIFTILNIFPKIDYYFEASKPIVKNINKSFLKKIEKKYSFLKLSYFKNVIGLNSRSFDEMKSNKKKSEDYIVFVDSYFDNPGRIIRDGKIKKGETIKYYKQLNKLLSLLSKIYKKKVVICIHPKNKNSLFKKYLSKFIIKKYQTLKMVRNAFIVLFHESSAALDAVLLNKNIISLNSEILGSYLSKRSQMYSDLLGIFSINLNNNYNLKKNKLDFNMRISKKKYQIYIKKYLNSDGNFSGYKKVVAIIKKQ